MDSLRNPLSPFQRGSRMALDTDLEMKPNLVGIPQIWSFLEKSCLALFPWNR